MNYTEIQEALKSMGVDVSIGTLYRYRRVGLLPEPQKGHGGRGQGPTINFPAETTAEAYAAWKLFNDAGVQPKTNTVVMARKEAMGLIARENKSPLIQALSIKYKELKQEWLQG